MKTGIKYRQWQFTPIVYIQYTDTGLKVIDRNRRLSDDH